MKQSLRVVLAIGLLSGLVPRVADCARNWTAAPLFSQTRPMHLKVGAALFDSWAAQEAKDLSWIERLPACPCYQHQIEYRPDFEAPSYSATDGFVRKYHPDAFMCYRSKKNEKGHAQQCCYDEKGGLFTFGPAAGTPDRNATISLKDILTAVKTSPDLVSHFFNDAAPVGFAVAKIRISLGENWEEPWEQSIRNETYIKDAWILYNAVRDDPRVTSCPQNPKVAIEKWLFLKGKTRPTKVEFYSYDPSKTPSSRRFLNPGDAW